MAALNGCVVCCSSDYWESCHLPRLICTMGGTCVHALEDSCTHVVTSSTSTPRYKVARSRFPHLPVVHPRWLWACYWSAAPVETERYAVDFYREAIRTGTSTARGSRAVFFRELPLFRAVEDRVLPHGIRGRCMANLLHGEGFDADSPFWPYVSRQLQRTTFWGAHVRQLNWARRRVLLLCLLRPAPPPQPPRPRMRSCQDGPVPVLRRVARLPPELWRSIVSFC